MYFTRMTEIFKNERKKDWTSRVVKERTVHLQNPEDWQHYQMWSIFVFARDWMFISKLVVVSRFND